MMQRSCAPFTRVPLKGNILQNYDTTRMLVLLQPRSRTVLLLQESQVAFFWGTPHPISLPLPIPLQLLRILCKWNYVVCDLLGSPFSHSVWFSGESAMGTHVSTVCSFSLVSSISRYVYIMMKDIWIRLMEDIWVISGFGLSLIKTLVYMFLHECKFLFPWDKYPAIGLLGYMIVTCFSRNYHCTFQSDSTILLLPFPSSKVWNQVSHIPASIWCYHFFFFFTVYGHSDKHRVI